MSSMDRRELVRHVVALLGFMEPELGDAVPREDRPVIQVDAEWLGRVLEEYRATRRWRREVSDLAFDMGFDVREMSDVEAEG